MNIVEFALKFKDLASSELHKFGNSARTTFNNAQRYADTLTGHNKELGRSYEAIQNRIKQVENTLRTSTIPSQIREARRELRELNREAERHPGGIALNRSSNSGGIGGMISSMGIGKLAGAAGLAAIGYKAAEFIGGAMKDSLERQQILTSFNVLAGSEQAGGALSKQLIALQKDTILGPEVFKNAQTMMGFGFKSTDVLPNLKMLGDISMGDAEKLNMLTLAYSQVRAAGKLQGQDLLQLINAGFNPLEQISQRTGKSIGQLKKEMEGGNVSFAMVKQAFQDATSEGGKFNNMLDTIAQTPAGKVQQLSGAWQEFKINAGSAFMPLISMALDLASKLMPIIEGFIVPLTNGISAAVTWFQSLTSQAGGFTSYVDTARNVFTFGILPVVKRVFGFVTDIVGKLVEFIANSELLKDIFRFIGIIVSNLFGFISLLIDGLKWVFDNVVMPILNTVEKVYRWIKGTPATAPVKTSPKPTLANPTDNTNSALLGDIARNTADNTAATKSAEKAITGGGPKVVNITVQKFLDSININSTTLESGVTDIESKILEMFARVVSQVPAAV